MRAKADFTFGDNRYEAADPHRSTLHASAQAAVLPTFSVEQFGRIKQWLADLQLNESTDEITTILCDVFTGDDDITHQEDDISIDRASSQDKNRIGSNPLEE